MRHKLKIDPKKVEYDGRTFRLIIHDEEQLIRELKVKQKEILKDLKRQKKRSKK